MSLKHRIVDMLEASTRFAYSWITENDEILGEIVYTSHLAGFYTLLVLIFVSHTFYPVFWFQVCVFLFLFVVWIQHIVLKTCVLTSLERRLMGPEHALTIDVLLNCFGIPIQKETRMGVTIMLSTAGVMFLGLELIARGSMYWRGVLGASSWI